MTIDITQFYQIFFEETAEHLTAMESLLLGLDVSDPSMDDLNAIFRAAHSIKGGAGAFGFNDMAEVTHAMETLLDKLRKQERKLGNEMVSALLEAGDAISMQLAAHRGEGEADAGLVRNVRTRLELLSAAEPVSPLPPSGVEKAAAEEVAASGQQDDPGYGFFDEPPTAAAPPQQDAGHPAGEAPVPGAGGAPSGRRAADHVQQQAETTSIRVSVEKVDQLVNLMGELVITHAMLAQSALQYDGAVNESLQRNLHQLEHNTRDLQETVMSIRMMPVSSVFSRFPRLVHDLAARLNKQVKMKMVGENTELDKGLIEKISDPLTHLVRNSLDHGIESPERRTAVGKPPCGTITLKAFHQGGNVVIEVSDDGAGLNRSKILAKAKERGLPLRDEMSDQEVWALIMEPGFSTAEVVTDVSGRGVGMDVVRRNIAGIGGRIELDSAEGLGTRIIIRLPLTLAILDGLSVSVGQETYIVPLNAIIESLPGSAADIKAMGGEGRLLRVRGEHLPIVALRRVFGIEAGIVEPERGILVLLEAEGRKIALFVDELIGQHQVVLKNLECNFRKVPYVSGATIMGDGRVALILDVAALVAQQAQAAKMAA
ncbi:MAG: chemotaxis protein CheW [Nitrosomonadales bacterium]|nr:chemotaxis protein CheW [Nitrosomonadales bacterium]